MLFSKQDLSRIIVPLLLQQTLAITVGMLDSVMVSSAGEAAVSGVSLVDTVNNLLVYVFSALAAGGAVIISQSLGCKNLARAKAAAKQLIWVVFLSAFLITALAVIFRDAILSLIFGSIPAEIMQNAQVYFLYTALSYPFLGIHNACSAIFRAGGNSKLSLYTSILINALNIAGNAILIYAFHLGAAGAAIATLISRMAGAFIMLRCNCSPKSPIPVENLFTFRPQWSLIKPICQIGIPNGIENGMFQFGKVITQSLIATFGAVQIAANAAANPLTALQYIPGGAMGLAMTVVVGRCIGAGELSQAKHYTKKLVTTTYLLNIAISIPLCLFSWEFVGLYHLSEESTALGVQLLFMHSVMVCTVWPTAFTLAHAFRAASDVRYPMVISILSMWVFRVGLSFVLGQVMEFGLIGVWIAMGCDWLFRAVIYGIHYLRGTWLTKYETPSA